MLPIAQITKTDGNLGVAANTDRILAIIGSASSGDFDTAGSYTNRSDITDEFTSGPLVEAGAYMVDKGIPVVLIRSNPTTAGTYGTIDDAGVTGTAIIVAGATAPVDEYDVIVEIVTGGALATAGIIFKYSMDAGENWSNDQALGTSLTMTLEAGVSFTLSVATNTFIAGDTFSVTTVAPVVASADVTDSCTALTAYSGDWLRVLVLCKADATILANLDTFAESFHAEGKYPEVITNTRARNLGAAESRATYQTALAAIAAAVQSTEVSCCADQCELVSSVSGRRLRRPVAIPFAARTMLIDDSQDAAAKADGALPGVFLSTPAFETVYHDERRNPGLDALGFTTLRSWGSRPLSPGAYVCNPRLLSGAGSDYRYFQLSAIVNRIIESAFSLVEPKLSMSVLLNESGTIREDVATSIEDAVTAELRTRYSDPGRVSGVRFTLSRTDNVLSTDQLTFNVQIQPLAYVKKFIGKAGLVRVLAA